MLNGVFTRVIGGWAMAVALIVAASMAMGASAWTTALFVALCVVPLVVAALLGDRGSSSPSVAQILHPENTKDGVNKAAFRP